MAIARHKTRQRELRDERALTRRVQRGDRRAFELLYASYEGRLYRFCYRLTGSSVNAAALVEATFTRALADLPEEGLDSLDVAGFLYGTARGLAYERHTNGGPPEADARGERAREVAAANRRLAPRQRMTLVLRDLEGRPDDEIAVALGSGEESVAALVARARLRLRAELALPAALAACDARLPELSAYSDGTLPAAERPAIEAHVAGCAHCRAALFALREAELRYRSLPVPAPPGELGTRMAAALDAVGLAALKPPAAAPAREEKGGRQTAAAAAMAALVIVGAGVTIAAWRNADDGSKSHTSVPAPSAQTRADASSGTRSSLAAGGRQTLVSARQAAPPTLHHLRSGPLGFPQPPAPPPDAAAIAPPTPVVTSPAAPQAPPAAPAAPPPPVKVVIVPPVAPPATPSPAEASPPAAEPPPPAQTTST